MAEEHNTRKQTDDNFSWDQFMAVGLGLTSSSPATKPSIQPVKQESNHQASPQTSVVFNLFVYRMEKARKKRRFLRLTKAKLNLTEGLVSNSIPEEEHSNDEDLTYQERGIMYRNKLKMIISKLEMLKQSKKKEKVMAKCI